MNFSKKDLLGHCKELLTSKRQMLSKELGKLREAAVNETKSSMGDKYETSREMMRQEESKLASQLGIVEEQMVGLDRIDPERSFNKVDLGSLVQTETTTFFIAGSLGKLTYDSESIFCISAAAPLAKLLMGKEVGDEIQFNTSQSRCYTLIVNSEL